MTALGRAGLRRADGPETEPELCYAPRLFQPSRRSKGTFDPNDLDSSTILKIIHLFVEQIRELMEEECLQDIEVEFRCSLRADTSK